MYLFTYRVVLQNMYIHIHVYTCNYNAGTHIHIMYMKMTALGVLCCFALFVCLTLLASFFLPSHLSFKNMYICWKLLINRVVWL